MNYRHAYHAGNFADCVKHILLLEILRAMQRKAKPFLFLDTHAGIGRYDLSTGAAEKTGEWRHGIFSILAARPPALSDYLTLVDSLGLYPGSPAIAAFSLRPGDRMIACEMHPEDARLLKTAFAGTEKNIAIHERDGYAALKAFLPPLEKRALILIDPPYEQPDEFSRLTENLGQAYARFKTGTYVIWYPIKHRAPTRNFLEAMKLTPIRDVITAEFWLREPVDPTRLNGCGLLIVNPPYDFAAAAAPLLRACQMALGEAGAGFAVERLIDE